MRQQWFTHVRLLIAHPPRYSETSTAALTTPALDRRSLRWFGISACTATPEDLPPSLAQHGSCGDDLLHRPSSLPFRTHVGARNSAVVVDLPRLRADAESSCTESRTDSWSQDGARKPLVSAHDRIMGTHRRPVGEDPARAPGEGSSTSSSPPWNGSTGSTAAGSTTTTSAACRQPKPRTSTTVNNTQSTRPRLKPNSLRETR